VKIELVGDRLHLLRRGPVHADPRHSMLLFEQLVGLLEGVRDGGALAIDIYGVVHNRHVVSLPYRTAPNAAWHTGHVNSTAVASPRTLRRWRQYLADERAEAQLYRRLAERRKGEEREILLALADAEGRHEAHWLELLGSQAGTARRVDIRTGLLVLFARVFGSVFVLALAQRAEGRSPYATDSDATSAMAADEAIHAEVVRGLAARGRNRLSGTFRAAIFGANDGLVSNLSLVLGVTAAGLPAGGVLATGIVGLLAGALSMAAGEYVSVRSQRELLEASAPNPHAEDAVSKLDVDANELALVYRARGMSKKEAAAHAAEVLAAHGPSARTGAKARIFDAGVTQPDDHEAIGTGFGAAASSFCFFASGAIVPMIPFFFGLSGTIAATVAAILVGAALLGTGAIVGLLSGGSPIRRALRQLLLGFGAALIATLLGLVFHASGV
jgi:VIT1/CCC1 family predicted Fe2+/Mn2+ transporter